MSFKIVTDSTADLLDDFCLKENITVIPFSYTIAGETYGESKMLPIKDFYSLMREGNNPITSQINPESAKNVLSSLAEEYNEILYISFSSGLSGAYNSARLAAMEVMEDKPDVSIKVCDSLCASMGEGLLVYKAVMMRNEGHSLDETYEWVEAHKMNMIHMFTVDDLNYLFRGGRVSKSVAVVGSVLNIKPILHVDDEGHLVLVGNVRGRKKALLSLVDNMERKMCSYKDKNDIIFISHCDCEEDALFVKEEVKNRFGIDAFMMNYIGHTVGAHSGPGTVALFFMGDER